MQKVFRRFMQCMVAVFLFSSGALGAEPELRHFIFIGEPSAASWKYMMDNPEGRKQQVEAPSAANAPVAIDAFSAVGVFMRSVAPENPV